MAKTDYTWVSTPHDPRSISGSDPHNKTGDARLAGWYNCDEGNYVKGPKYDGALAQNAYRCDALKDISGNSSSSFFSTRVDGSGDNRHLYRQNDMIPIVSGNADAVPNQHMMGHGDRQQLLMGSNALDSTVRGIFLTNRGPTGTTHSTATSAMNWISGSSTSDTTNQMVGGYSLFTTMRMKTADATGYRLNVTYPCTEDAAPGDNDDCDFSIGLYDDGNTTNRDIEMRWQTEQQLRTESGTLLDDWYCITGIYDQQIPIEGSALTKWQASLYQNSILEDQTILANKSATSTSAQGVTIPFPTEEFDNKRIAIGGVGTTGGGQIASSDMEAYMNGVHEMFVFDDALSNIRRQQMDAYLCDRLELEMSASDYLSNYDGGVYGRAQVHADLSSPLGTGGVWCRKYKQAATSSAAPTIHHETLAGGFAKSTLDSSAYYRTPSTAALSLRMYVRCTELNDDQHSGSFAALVAKASSPWGHGMDNIKGYALKFGTFKNGLDQPGDTPQFILSLRNGDRWLDGSPTPNEANTAYDTPDIVVTNTAGGTPAAIATPAINTWYLLRLDVIPFGHLYDEVKAYASVNGGSNWYQLGATQKIERDSKRYRHWCDDADFPVNSDDNNGIHNGFLVAMSSSKGEGLKTTYYIDNFNINTDTVA
jgi:hypothetical protein